MIALPESPDAFKTATWEDVAPYYEDLATRPLAEQMNASCAAVPPEVDEFVLAGLTPVPSRKIAVPRVAEAPVTQR